MELTDPEKLNLESYSSQKSLDTYRAKRGLSKAEEYLINKYLIPEKGFILDLGCGMGRVAWELFDKGLAVIGVDVSQEMVKAAQKRHPHIDFYVGNACEQYWEDGTFTSVIFAYNGIDLIYPLSKRLLALQEIHRVLKPGGIFIYSSHNVLQMIPQFLSKPSSYLGVLKNLLWNMQSYNMKTGYRATTAPYGNLIVYVSTPKEEGVFLRRSGFELLEQVGNKFSAWSYYAARRKEAL